MSSTELIHTGNILEIWKFFKTASPPHGQIRLFRKWFSKQFQIKIPDSSFKFLFPFVGKLVLHRLHCSAKLIIIFFGCSHSTYCVVMFHFLFCVVFSKLLQTPHYCLCPSPCSCWPLTILWKETSYLNASILIFTPSLSSHSFAL